MSDLQVSFRTNILSLNDDCLEIVKEFLTSGISSLYNIGATCRKFRSFFHSQDFLGQIVRTNMRCKMIESYSIIPEVFLCYLKDLGGISYIGGSFPLQCLTGINVHHYDEKWKDADIDVYIENSNGTATELTPIVEKFFSSKIWSREMQITVRVRKFYSSVWNPPAAADCIHGILNITAIPFRGTRTQEVKLQLIFLKPNKSVSTLIHQSFDFTFAQSVYNVSNDKFYIPHPIHLVRREGSYTDRYIETLSQLWTDCYHNETTYEHIPREVKGCTYYLRTERRICDLPSCDKSFKSLKDMVEGLEYRKTKYEARGFKVVGKKVPKNFCVDNPPKQW